MTESNEIKLTPEQERIKAKAETARERRKAGVEENSISHSRGARPGYNPNMFGPNRATDHLSVPVSKK